MLPRNQMGLRMGHSTADCLTGLTINIEDTFSCGKGLLVAFLDVNSAFTSVNPQILLCKISDVRVTLSTMRYVKFSTFQRFVYSDCLGDGYRSLYQGVPQGGVPSPLLYNLYIADICKGLSKRATILQFADDIAIFCKWASLDSCKSTLSKAIGAIDANLCEIGLEHSPHETKLIYFNRKSVKTGGVFYIVYID